MESQKIEELLERAQRPRILHDIIHPPSAPKKADDSKQVMKLINRINERRAINVTYSQCVAATQQLHGEVNFLKHFPKCPLCKAELIIGVERYMGTRLFWWLNLQNEEYLPETYPGIPRADDYHIGNYWEQLKWYEKHGNTDVPGENTYQFILDRAKYAYKVYGIQIHAVREMRRLLQKWDFSDAQHQEYLRLYEQLENYEVIIPFS